MGSEQPSEEGKGVLRSGEVLTEKYRIERLLGQGGMGAVYLAHHEILNQHVALKTLLPEIAENAEAVARFLNEARASARIRNEHVAQVMDVGKLPNGSAYMVLEYLEGSDLSAVLDERGPLPIMEAVDYLLQSLEAVSVAHAIGIIHRDLKPANLFLTKRQDGSPFIKVLDFGISKAQNPLTPSASSGVTATRAVLGSPAYMSPEQVKSSKHVDARADIWSMGVILYRLLTNVAPFDGETLGAVFAAIIEETPAPVSSHRPEIPPELDAVVKKCLARNRDERYQDCGELATALVPFASPDGVQSVDRVCRSLGRTSRRTAAAMIPTPAPMPVPVAATVFAPVAARGAGEGTNAPWSDSMPPGTGGAKRSRTAYIVAGVAIAVMALAGVGALRMMGSSSGAQGANAAASPPAPTATAAATDNAAAAIIGTSTAGGGATTAESPPLAPDPALASASASQPSASAPTPPPLPPAPVPDRGNAGPVVPTPPPAPTPAPRPTSSGSNWGGRL
jgi:tRNA A-37 threonylcarbamoyl transferase component Bud32